jgi:hypothetical protein
MADFNKQRLTTKTLVKTPFQRGWQFRIELSNQPSEFDLFVKDVTFAPIEIETESIKAGSHTLTFPVSAAPVSISMTMRDHTDERIYKWFDGLSKKVLNEDGTVNLPKDYCINWKRFIVLEDGSEMKSDMAWQVYPTKLGDITESRDDDGFKEFPITFMQFRAS